MVSGSSTLRSVYRTLSLAIGVVLESQAAVDMTMGRTPYAVEQAASDHASGMTDYADYSAENKTALTQIRMGHGLFGISFGGDEAACAESIVDTAQTANVLNPQRSMVR